MKKPVLAINMLRKIPDGGRTADLMALGKVFIAGE